MIFRRSLGLGLAALLLGASGASAHDPLEATVDIEVRPAELAFHIVMARSVAAYLSGFGENPRIYFPPENFSANREKFDRAAAALCDLRVGAKAVTPSKIETKLTSESDVEFILTYPAAARAAVEFEAKWIAQLPPHGFVGIFAVKTKGYHLPGRLLVFAEKPSLALQVLPDAPASVAAPSS